MGENPWVVEEESNKPPVAPSDGKSDKGSAGQDQDDCQSQSAFEKKVKVQVGKLLRGRKPEQKALRIGLAGKLSMSAENNAVPALVDQLWMPDDPLAVIAVLRDATQEALDEVSIREDGATAIQKVWDNSTRVLGYLMLCLVSREWADCQQEASNPYYDIPLSKKISLELVSASVNETAACLMSMTEQDLNGLESEAEETFVPENGWLPQGGVTTIVEGIYRVREPDKSAEERNALLNKVRLEIEAGGHKSYTLGVLNETLKIEHEDGIRNHYLAIHWDNAKHPAQCPVVCQQLKNYLPALPIVRFGGMDHDQVILHLDESVLAARIIRFLKLIEDYQ